MIPKDEWRLLALATLGFMLSMFVLANEPEGGVAASWYIYLILFWVGMALWLRGKQGISKTWMSNALFGAAFGGLFVAMNMWEPSIFRLGYPQAVASVQLLVVGFIAPIGEEIAFRQGLFLMVLRPKFSFIESTIACAAIFAAFHWYAYGLGAASAAFVGAFIFGVIACWLTERTKDCVASTTAHAIINLYLISTPFVVIGA